MGLKQQTGTLKLGDRGLVLVYTANASRPGRKQVERTYLLGELKDLENAALNGRVVDTYIKDGNKVVAVWPAGESAPTDEQVKALREGAQGSFESVAQVARDKFLNPYAYVWTPDRAHLLSLNEEQVGAALGDSAPPSRARWQPGLWSGRIVATLTTRSPLLVFGNEPTSEVQQHKTYDALKDSEGRPVLPGTVVKGLLRADYEAVTNSRYGVFAGHRAPRTRRMTAEESQNLVPGRLVKRQASGRDWVEFEPYPGQDSTTDPEKKLLSKAAWVPYYEWKPDTRGPANPHQPALTRPYTRKHSPPGGTLIAAQLVLYQHYRRKDNKWTPTFRYWRVQKWIPWTQQPGEGRDAELIRATEALGSSDAKTLFSVPTPASAPDASINGRTFHRPLGDARAETTVGIGYVVVSGPNMPRKHDERFFFGRAEAPVVADATYLDGVLKGYAAEHDGEDLKGERRDGGFVCHYSSHLQQYREAGRVPDQIFCYARLTGTGQVDAVHPVPISRALFQNSPSDLLPASLQPADSLGALSPADRVFGWVGAKGGAFRGGLRVHSVSRPDKAQVRRFQPPMPVQVLGTPKNYGRFALVVLDADGRPQSLPSTVQSKDFYSQPEVTKSPQRLAGRKFYWTHTGLSENYWDAGGQAPDETGRYPEYRHPASDGKQRGKFNRSVAEWIQPGTEFSIALDVFNLSGVELGALLWYLRAGMRRSTGYGKPLGFGAVEWSLDEARCSLIKGAELRSAYEDPFKPSFVEVDGEVPGEQIRELIAKFEEASRAAWSNDTLESAPHLADLRAVARGRRDLAVHYPRTTPKPAADGKNFEWFVLNEKHTGARRALGRPSDREPSLPVDPTSPSAP